MIIADFSFSKKFCEFVIRDHFSINLSGEIRRNKENIAWTTIDYFNHTSGDQFCFAADLISSLWLFVVAHRKPHRKSVPVYTRYSYITISRKLDYVDWWWPIAIHSFAVIKYAFNWNRQPNKTNKQKIDNNRIRHCRTVGVIVVDSAFAPSSAGHREQRQKGLTRTIGILIWFCWINIAGCM